MHYKIETAQDHVRVEVFGRETAEETREYLQALAAKVLESGLTRVLIWVRNSRPIFKVDEHGITGFFRLAASNPAYRVALLGDSDEVRASQQYIEVLASQHGANVRAFRAEMLALRWLRAETAQSQEKR
jgi:hypothetical protein